MFLYVCNPNYFWLSRTYQENKLHGQNVQIWQRKCIWFHSAQLSAEARQASCQLLSIWPKGLQRIWPSRFPSSGKDITGLQPYGLGCEGFQGLEQTTATKSGSPHLPRAAALKATDGLTYIQCPVQPSSIETAWVWEGFAPRWEEANFKALHISTFNRKVHTRGFYKQSFENNICLHNSKHYDSTMTWCLVHLRYLVWHITISKGVSQNSYCKKYSSLLSDKD